MTGGVVVVLGPVGLNLGAGMTGGVAYVHDPAASLPALVNHELVEAHRPDEAQLEVLRGLIERHADVTASSRARSLLAQWESAASAFWRVAPRTDVDRITQKNEGTLRAAPA
jgi:glutamate synthase domain-containing protein 3